MRNEEKLRKALNWLVHLHHGCSKGGERHEPFSDEEWKECLEEAKATLAAAADGPEMEKLVEWLETFYAETKEHERAASRGKQYIEGYADAVHMVLRHIRTEFLGTKEG